MHDLPPNNPCTRLALASPAPLPCPNPHSRLSHRPPAALPARHLPTRFRALALFSRRPPERVVRSSLPAAENLHMSGHSCDPRRPYSCRTIGHLFSRGPRTEISADDFWSSRLTIDDLHMYPIGINDV